VSVLANRAKERTTTTGTGSFAVNFGGGGAAFDVPGFVGFNAAFGIDRRCAYWAVNDADGEWESGIGYLSSSTVLVRETILKSSNSDAVVNFTVGPTLFSSPHEGSFLPAWGGFPANTWIHTSHMCEASQGLCFTVGADEIHYVPFKLCIADVFNEFTIDVRIGGGAGTFIKLGLYDMKNALPENLLAVHDTDIAVSTTGIKVASFDGGNLALQPAWYYVGVACSGTPWFDSWLNVGQYNCPTGTQKITGAIIPITSITKTRTYANMPDPADLSGASVTVDRVPIIAIVTT